MSSAVWSASRHGDALGRGRGGTPSAFSRAVSSSNRSRGRCRAAGSGAPRRRASTRGREAARRSSRRGAGGGGGAGTSGSPARSSCGTRGTSTVCVSAATTPSSSSIRCHSSACPNTARAASWARRISSAVAPVSSASRNANVDAGAVDHAVHERGDDDLAPQRVFRDPIARSARARPSGSTRDSTGAKSGSSGSAVARIVVLRASILA